MSPIKSHANLLGRIADALRMLRLSAAANILDAWASAIQTANTLFHMPPDSDDTGCAQAVVGQLVAVASKCPQAAARAAELNQDHGGMLFRQFCRYSYR